MKKGNYSNLIEATALFILCSTAANSGHEVLHDVQPSLVKAYKVLRGIVGALPKERLVAFLTILITPLVRKWPLMTVDRQR